MIKVLLAASILAVSVSQAFATDLPLCTSQSSIDSLCIAQVSDLHPLQMAVGMREVKVKEEELRSHLNDAKELAKFKKKKKIPTVIGPEGQFYITDHHHLALAASEVGKENEAAQTVVCEIKATFLQSQTDFWGAMEAQKWVYPVDNQGVRHPYSDLPSSVEGLQDDPYRSLASAVEKSGGFTKVEIPFQEFAWANYFRDSKVNIGSTEEDFQKAVETGLLLAKDPAAAKLPGYIGQSAGSAASNLSVFESARGI